jgi:hypothetical protein
LAWRGSLRLRLVACPKISQARLKRALHWDPPCPHRFIFNLNQKISHIFLLTCIQTKHLFLRILCHELSDSDEPFLSSAAMGSTLTDLPRSESPTPFTDTDADLELREMGKGDFGDDEKTLRGTGSRRRKSQGPLLPTSRSDLQSKPRTRLTNLSTERHDNAAEATKLRRIEEASIHALKSGERVNVKVSPMFIFLLRNGAQDGSSVDGLLINGTQAL